MQKSEHTQHAIQSYPELLTDASAVTIDSAVLHEPVAQSEPSNLRYRNPPRGSSMSMLVPQSRIARALSSQEVPDLPRLSDGTVSYAREGGADPCGVEDLPGTHVPPNLSADLPDVQGPPDVPQEPFDARDGASADGLPGQRRFVDSEDPGLAPHPLHTKATLDLPGPPEEGILHRDARSLPGIVADSKAEDPSRADDLTTQAELAFSCISAFFQMQIYFCEPSEYSMFTR